MTTTVVDVLVPPLAEPFSYELPEKFEQADTGYCVLVPFGRRRTNGFIIRKRHLDNPQQSFNYKLKSVESLVGAYHHFLPDQLRLFEWVANYYAEPVSRVLEVAIPPAVPPKYRRLLQLNKLANTEELKGSLQRRVIGAVTAAGGTMYYDELVRRLPGAGAALKPLIEREILSASEEELKSHHISDAAIPTWTKGAVTLSAEQQSAYERIAHAVSGQRFEPFLLHGITGSGKTEVYIEAAEYARRQGKGVLVIVPEIALTPQLLDRFCARLGRDIAVLHSALNKRARWDAWRALLERRTFLAIGARSAIFAPAPNLGLIIVDEEHDQSYKQSEGLRYHARDLALMRGRMESCPVVLGSATPSLESYANALRKKYTLLPLVARHGTASLSSIEVVDLNKIKPWEMATKNISPRLFEELTGALERGEQSFILYNRRGFATFFQCDRCEEVVRCPHCSVTLTYHRGMQTLLCHYCGFNMYPPTYCTACATKAQEKKEGDDEEPGRYVQRGAGTERIFDEVRELFPHARVERLDRDVASDMSSYRAILDRVRAGETQILVGTQMIAKGHDLPEVTLVGIADCDVGLHMPDFRSSEKIFQLLTQAAGRAGRSSKPGRVVLQTRVPQHPCILTTLQKDYKAFAAQELKARKLLGYPPFGRLLRIIVSSSEQSYPEKVLHSFTQHIVALIDQKKLAVTVLGPTPCPISRVKNEWRAHLLIKSAEVAALHEVLSCTRNLKIKSTKVSAVFDVDPYDLL